MSQDERAHPRDTDTTVRAEASVWLARLHGPGRTPDVEAGLRRWLQTHPDHRRAFETVTEVWEQLTCLRPSPMPRLIPNRAAFGLLRLARGVAAALGVVALGLGLHALFGSPSYATGVGEQRQIILTDGSRVWLNARTRLEVEYRSSVRQIRLREGEAYFEVSHDPQRPFVVVAGSHTVTALGTVFDVRYLYGHASVTLLEGRVRVAAALADGRGPGFVEPVRTLYPGERLQLEQNGPEVLDKPELSAVTAWRYGEIMFDNMTLSDAVEALNRDSPTQVILDNAEVGSLRVSGIYHTGDNLEFSRAVAALYGLDVIEQDAQLHLRKRAGPSGTITAPPRHRPLPDQAAAN